MSNVIIVRGTINIRERASINSKVLAQAVAGDTGYCTNVVPDNDGAACFWLNVGIDNKDGTFRIGWIRDELPFIAGDFSLFQKGKYLTEFVVPRDVFGLPNTVNTSVPPPASSGDLTRWSPPVTPYFVTEHYLEDQGAGKKHQGVDMAGAIPTPIFAQGPGTVWQANTCLACPGWNGAVAGTGDPKTNYGFGNEVIIEHQYQDLPSAAVKAMNAVNMMNGFLYEVMGHLDSFVVKPGQVLKKGDLIGYRGTSGNSSGPHLHVELRARAVRKQTDLWSSDVVVLDPNSLYAI